MEKRYQVVAACIIHVPVATANGQMLSTLYSGAVIEGDRVPADKILHLLAGGQIVEIGEDGAPVKAKPVAEQKPADEGDPAGGGKAEAGKVTARSSKADLVAYAVANSDLTREEAEALTVKDLLARFVKAEQQQPPAE